MDNPAPLGAEMIRPTIEALPASRIREVANAGIGRSDILKFWFGEGDQVTPAFIRDAAKAALDAGETFYNHNLGLIERWLRMRTGFTLRPSASMWIASQSPVQACMRCR